MNRTSRKTGCFGSHFYTHHAAECAALVADPGPWQYEGIAFYLQLPGENGNCPIDTIILYRLFNANKYWPLFYYDTKTGAPLHRYTTSVATFNQMRAAGWVFEGDSRTFAFACVPVSTAPLNP